ncbi:MAG: hypothetical protein PHP26_11590 [Syntrophomonas sp.]|uniref:hypothetical protein n=1 Tax=Syntrophomonas sp. TaxID=2053627 RepID=UPI002627E9AB|nr:hypothetical protein [Syntrophomonas sp.]MDD2509740.1 hypothetical protein [Syntrophomonas sp.]MDD3880611.1 hypothetical protein [Syntrophomonas sp.]MDD4625872.1 hypothetical protein [Syntrophomonas sp.]
MLYQDRKEFIAVLLIVVLSVVIGLLLINQQSELQIIRPETEMLLDKEDFYVSTDKGSIRVGESSWEEIQKLLPGGKMLGMSTIYQSKEGDCLFTFSEDENLLLIMHIEGGDFATARGIKIGDSFDKISQEYGTDCARVIMPQKAEDFDLVYGGENNIVFQIRDNVVKRIVLEKELSLKQ